MKNIIISLNTVKQKNLSFYQKKNNNNFESRFIILP